MENSDDELYFDISHKNGISNDLAAEMSKLAFNDLHSDIIVVCEGKPYFCHKVKVYYKKNKCFSFTRILQAVLYTQSRLFREWLQQNPEADMIILTDVLSDNIEKVLSVLYSGKVLVSTLEVNVNVCNFSNYFL